MDQRELHLQPLGICYKLYNFIIKTLASQALKTVTLGRPNLHYGATSTREHAVEKNKPFKRNIIDGVVRENNNRIASLPQAPKKMVIINEE
ncbi:hypothetical protein HN51_014641 [Arachis hypogaea]|nr:uncharacterized protein DS421_6g179160 [Arachis hypogaea]